MGVPAKSFVISFGEARVSPHSISFSHTLFDGLRFSFGITFDDLIHGTAMSAK